MGHIQSAIDYRKNPDVVPKPYQTPKWDSNVGFPEGREPKVMLATEEEMYSAKLDLEDRDYCAHILLKYRKCYRDNFPWIVSCHHEKHEYMNCQYQEFIDRMKDYEREKRLNEREQRKAAAA